MNRFFIVLCKILAALGILTLLAYTVLSPRWAARPEALRAATPSPETTPQPVETLSPTPEVTPSPTPTATPAPTPSPAPTPTPTPESYTISLVGDCTLASYPKIRFWEIAFENVVKEDWSYPFSNMAELFHEDELTMVNLECSISDQIGYPGSTFSFLAPSSAVNILTEGGVEFAGTANNHAMDFGWGIYEDTLANLDRAGIAHCGNEESTLITTRNGISVGVYTAYSGHYSSPEGVADGVRRLKEQGAEIVVVYAHWGDEASYYQNGNQIAVAHAAIDAGADIVAGHGPHRLQPMEEYNRGVIFYSLGNFVFGGNTQPADMDTAIAQVTFTRQEDGTLVITDHRALPGSISSQYPLNDYRPTLFDEGTEDYARAMSKIDGSWTGANNVIDYSFMHEDSA